MQSDCSQDCTLYLFFNFFINGPILILSCRCVLIIRIKFHLNVYTILNKVNVREGVAPS